MAGPYAVDRTQLPRRGAASQTPRRPASAGLAVPVLEKEKRVPETSFKLPVPKEVDVDPELPEVEVEEPPVPAEAEEAAEEAIDAMEPEEAQVQTVQTAPEVSAPASRLPKPTEVSAETEANGSRAGAASQPRAGLKQRPSDKAQRAPARQRTPQRTGAPGAPLDRYRLQAARFGSPRPEMRDVASSPVSNASGLEVNSSESLNALLRELGNLREDFIVAKLESERARERVLQLEEENWDLKRQLQEAESAKRQLQHEKQDLEHASLLWRQRWEDSQQQAEQCWSRFDAMQKLLEKEKNHKEDKAPEVKKGTESFAPPVSSEETLPETESSAPTAKEEVKPRMQPPESLVPLSAFQVDLASPAHLQKDPEKRRPAASVSAPQITPVELENRARAQSDWPRAQAMSQHNLTAATPPTPRVNVSGFSGYVTASPRGIPSPAPPAPARLLSAPLYAGTPVMSPRQAMPPQAFTAINRRSTQPVVPSVGSLTSQAVAVHSLPSSMVLSPRVRAATQA
ncbi:unnamed protein product [Effrenium voratum]|uniref:Uncharacterized protein n=1 Tax=Effrenium voratum TaxID=2562239 RepID=A0AA36N9S6_9DINO|nr:unnamed protein product [Effrenium voratum]